MQKHCEYYCNKAEIPFNTALPYTQTLIHEMHVPILFFHCLSFLSTLWYLLFAVFASSVLCEKTPYHFLCSISRQIVQSRLSLLRYLWKSWPRTFTGIFLNSITDYGSFPNVVDQEISISASYSVPSGCAFLWLRYTTSAPLLLRIQLVGAAEVPLSGPLFPNSTFHLQKNSSSHPPCLSDPQSKHLSCVQWGWVVPGAMLYQNNNLKSLFPISRLLLLFFLLPEVVSTFPQVFS